MIIDLDYKDFQYTVVKKDCCQIEKNSNDISINVFCYEKELSFLERKQLFTTNPVVLRKVIGDAFRRKCVCSLSSHFTC